MMSQAVASLRRASEGRQRYEEWKREREKELEQMAQDISGRLNF